MTVLYTVMLFLLQVEVDVDRINYPGCQFDVHFIQCQTSTDIF